MAVKYFLPSMWKWILRTQLFLDGFWLISHSTIRTLSFFFPLFLLSSSCSIIHIVMCFLCVCVVDWFTFNRKSKFSTYPSQKAILFLKWKACWPSLGIFLYYLFNREWNIKGLMMNCLCCKLFALDISTKV